MSWGPGGSQEHPPWSSQREWETEQSVAAMDKWWRRRTEAIERGERVLYVTPEEHRELRVLRYKYPPYQESWEIGPGEPARVFGMPIEIVYPG